MLSERVEIKVAIIGNVSAGKTTVLNALLRNKYAEVAKKRTTASASYFYLNLQPENTLHVNKHSAESTYQEIKDDNKKKVSNGHDIYKKDFEIVITEPLVRCRQDTILVVVDIPGINEAGTDNKYKEFVSNHWKTFDCVIVVMDGKAGVNTEDEVSLLNFVKINNMTKKQIPIIILCNKIDNPDDEEQEELVEEARKEVEKIFNVTCRETSLHTLMSENDSDEIQFQQDMSPTFIPMSAGNAYMYRCGSKSKLENFSQLGIDVIDGFGRNQFGQKLWKTLSTEERIGRVHSMVSNPKQYNDGMKDCNFDALLKVLEIFIGESRQSSLIQEKVQIAIDEVCQGPFEIGKITETIRAAYKNLTRLGTLELFGGIANLQNKFWLAHSRFESDCYKEFTDAWPKQHVSILAGPMEELISYFQFVNKMKAWENEMDKIFVKGEKWICQYFKFLLEENALLKKKKYEIANKLNGTVASYEWVLILESILLLSYNEHFCRIFGRTKIEFSTRLLKANNISDEGFTILDVKCPKCQKERIMKTNNSIYGVGLVCENCISVGVKKIKSKCFQCQECFIEQTAGSVGFSFGATTSRTHVEKKKCISCLYETNFEDFDDNIIKNHSALQQNYQGLLIDGIVPIHPNEYNNMVRINVPNSLTAPNHFGHLPYIYCRLAEQIAIDTTTNTYSLKRKHDIVNEKQQQQESTNCDVSPKPKHADQNTMKTKCAFGSTSIFSSNIVTPGSSFRPSSTFSPK